MNWEALPIPEIMNCLKTENDSIKAFDKVVKLSAERLPSLIWNEYNELNIEKDIKEATIWLQKWIDKFPKSKGIYFGLDTLNMDNGKGTNVLIGLSENCDPQDFSSEWIYDCEGYGDSHLIKGLFTVSDSFENEEKWTDEERSFAEYIIFLVYSGLVLREALLNIDVKRDFLSIWGFHDGDSFFLLQKKGVERVIVTDIEIEEG